MKLMTVSALPKMIVIVFAGVLLSCVASGAAAQQSAGKKLQTLVDVPDKPVAADFSFFDIQGQTLSLSGYRGKVVVINFWATWCAPCRKEMPSLQRTWEQIRDKGGVVLAVNYWSDSKDDVMKFFENLSVDFPILLGDKEELTESWPVRGLPTTFVVDPEGRLVYQVEGDIEWDAPDIVGKILALNPGT
ncbi:MAG: TlpA disulfide reductase family protein [Candidatus Competibacteraceae bacterium]|nr:TlpA disulfide reductase family protein [Candidatus Competibacteraceae bacterium]